MAKACAFALIRKTRSGVLLLDLRMSRLDKDWGCFMMFSWSSVLGYSKWKGNERIGEIPENQGKCQDNELPMGKLMRFPFEDGDHRIGGDNYDNKLRSVAMRPMIKCWKARNVLNEIQKGAELSWHFFSLFFLVRGWVPCFFIVFPAVFINCPIVFASFPAFFLHFP